MAESCHKCGDPIELDRASWAETCTDCMAEGCPVDFADAEAGNRCDACDCLPPQERRRARR